MAVMIDGTVLSILAGLLILLMYFLWSFKPLKKFLDKHGSAADIFLIGLSIGVVIFIYYLPFLLPNI